MLFLINKKKIGSKKKVSDFVFVIVANRTKYAHMRDCTVEGPRFPELIFVFRICSVGKSL